MLQKTKKTIKQTARNLKNFASLSEIRESIQSGSVSCQSLVNYYLKRINNHKDLNVYVEVFTEEALKRAKQIDKKLLTGTAGRLAGMVIAIKDNICFEGHKVSAGSKILEGFESLYSATVVERLLNEDAIIIGRVNCDEFAMGSSNESSIHGAVKNPNNPSKVPGGSSGGSAAAVAADLCQVALGSDTGGSIRQPAAFCGVVGLKPTYARVSRYGLIAYASSFDQIGPIANNIFDSKIVDKRLPNISQNKTNLDNENFSLLDAIEKLNLVKSRSEIKRLIKSNGVKINDNLYNNSNFSLKEFSNLNEIKISIGKKKIGILKII